VNLTEALNFDRDAEQWDAPPVSSTQLIRAIIDS